MRPTRQDPTGTTSIQRKFYRHIVREQNKVYKGIYQLVVREDAFGLAPSRLSINTQYAFETDSRKVAIFQQRLQELINQGILSTDTADDGLSTVYVRSSYKKAVVDAFLAATSSAGLASDFYAGTQAQFLQEAFDSPIPLDRVQMLSTRTFENLKGITSQMSTDLNRIFADGIAHGRNPRTIAREIKNNVSGIDKKRALRLARTEVVHTYAEGSLDSYERLGVEEVGAKVEWSTAGDDLVCPRCAALEGQTFPIKKARGMIPLHPNCRCAWLPVID